MKNIESKTLPWTLLIRKHLEKLDVVFDSLKCAAKLILAVGFVPENKEDWSCRFYYAHEKKTLSERSKLVATTEDLTKVKNLLTTTDVIESCTRERANIKWKFYKMTNVTIFAALLKEIPKGCKDSVLPFTIFKNLSVKCLTFEERTRKPYNDNLCLLRALALHFHGGKKHDEDTSIFFNLFPKNIGGTDPANFRCVCLEDIATEENNVKAYNFLYDLDFVEGSMIVELARRSVG